MNSELYRTFKLSAFASRVVLIVLLPLGGLRLSAAEMIVTERGPHHRIFERAKESIPNGIPDGGGGYTEFGVGMHYLKEGVWTESKELIEVVADGAVARQGQIQVIFANNIATPGAIDLQMPDGRRFRTHVLGIAISDTATGNSELIAEIQDSIGQLHPPNVVIYPDAFVTDAGVRGSVRYTYSLDRFEQDILLFDKLELPPGYKPATSQIEIWTEAVDFEEPQKAERQVEGQLDQTLVFPSMRIGEGRAFTLEDPQGATWSVPVFKQWIKAQGGRTFLIESVPYLNVKEQLDVLPEPVRGAAVNRPQPARKMASLTPGQRAFPPPLKRSNRAGRIQTAGLPQPQRGLVLDYSIVTTTANMTFTGDTTYYVSSPATLTGTTVFEGGAIIKCTNANSATARLSISGPVDCRATAYRPVFFTGKDDDTIGEIISGSSGNPATNYYGKFLDFAGNNNVVDLHDVRIRHAYYGINMDSSSILTLSHAQLGSNWTAIANNGGQSRLRNVLIHDGTHTLAQSGTNHGEHVTFHRLTNFRSSSYNNTWLTNCLVVSVTNWVIYTGINVASNISDAGFFQTVGAGSRYLLDGTYRNIGTTNINPSLLTDLRKRTTYAPAVATNEVSLSLTLFPQAQRDVDLPDLGYHYEALDYCWSDMTLTNATLLLTNGVAIAFFGDRGALLESGSKLRSEGSPNQMNRLLPYYAVQEGLTQWGGVRCSALLDLPSTPRTVSPEIYLRFTDISLFGHFDPNEYLLRSTTNIVTALTLRDCQMRGGYLILLPQGNSLQSQTVGITNCLFYRSAFLFYHAYLGDKTPVYLNMQNNLCISNRLHFLNFTNTITWWVQNNLFDLNELKWKDSLSNSHNAYFCNSNFPASGLGNKTLAAVDYQPGPLGNYYYPTSGANLFTLINAGGQNATNAGLYHFTTVVSQSKETNSVVDIGYHWMALNDSSAGSTPLDNESDGNFDYGEDLNGNGSYDASAGETDWKSYNSRLGIGGGPGLVVFTPLK